jgi:lipopolysaccharide transport system ATP-binding protein
MIPAVKIEAVSKRYLVASGGVRSQYKTLRESIMDVATAPVRRWRHGGDGNPRHEFWAVRDVDLEIAPGEVVALVGRNGAGKSTLLKILSRITAPTSGRITLNGRVGSLLEVGTGFHPELTGRENIFLNGAVLGMTRREIRSKFDQIVEFSGVGQFLDTPVKRYSSGMFVRLAFAVAAHLEPEILLVDEVLAVGDAEFQKKCLGKMRDIASGGRTVIFVSHNMNAVQRLCQRAVLLQKGQVVDDGPTDRIVTAYITSGGGVSAADDWVDVSDSSRRGNGLARFTAVRYRSPEPTVGYKPYTEGEVEVTLRIQAERPLRVDSLGVTFCDRYGTKLVNADTVSLGQSFDLDPGLNELSVRIERLYLKADIYVLGLWLADGMGNPYDQIESACELEVVEQQSAGFGRRPHRDGCVPCRFELVTPQAMHDPELVSHRA